MLWRPHPWLIPLNPLYRMAADLHRAWMIRNADREFRPRIPLVVIGSLKAGGSGKTSLTAALGKAMRAEGFHVAILVYRIGRGAIHATHADPIEVFPESDWRESSDEAVLLARETGARVFATRNRAQAWKRLHDPGRQDSGNGRPFDLILSDDGFQDPRLAGAIRLLVNAPGARPGWADLLPGGPYRETWAASARADLILEGPCSEASVPDSATGKTPRLRRRFILPADARSGDGTPREWIALAAHGDPGRFLADLERAGILPAAIVHGRNHAPLPLADLGRCLRRFPRALIVCTRKEAIRLEGREIPVHAVVAAEQTMEFEPSFLRFILDRCREFPRVKLVH